MAKITIPNGGKCFVVTSSLKLEDIKKIAKYRPRALTIWGGEKNNEPIFSVCATSGKGNFNANGVEFNSVTYDDEKLACVTLPLPEDVEDVKAAVAEIVGASILHLNKLEKQLPEVLDEIDAETAEVLENITVA